VYVGHIPLSRAIKLAEAKEDYCNAVFAVLNKTGCRLFITAIIFDITEDMSLILFTGSFYLIPALSLVSVENWPLKQKLRTYQHSLYICFFVIFCSRQVQY